MAALITRTLRDVPVKELRPLLQEEAEHWREELLWDYAEVSQAVARGAALPPPARSRRRSSERAPRADVDPGLP